MVLCLTTVTPPQAYLHLPHDHHTSPPTDTLDCHTPCQLSHLPGDNHASLTLFNNCHTSLPAFTLPKWHSHFLHSPHTTCTVSHFPDNSHTSPSNLHTSYTLLIILTTLPLPKHIPHDYHTCPITGAHLSNNFHNFMSTSILSDNCYTSLAANTSPSIISMPYLWSSHRFDSCDISFVVSTPNQWLSHLTISCYICLTCHILQEH